MDEAERLPEALLETLGEERAREILLLASRGPVSVEALADELGVAKSTVYRHVNPLTEAGVLHERVETDDEGHHYRTYETALDEVTLRFDDGRLTADVSVDRSLVDRFQGFFDGLGRSAPALNVTLRDVTDDEGVGDD